MRPGRERTGVELRESLQSVVIGTIGQPEGDRPLPGREPM
jgi:hypothetical protein